jgi:hypothetical protein
VERTTPWPLAVLCQPSTFTRTRKSHAQARSAGLDEKDLDVRVENHTLTVKDVRKFEREENFHRIERRYGSFFRAFTLPNTVDAENVKADYHNSVLKLELAKKPEAQPRQIKVNVGSIKQWLVISGLAFQPRGNLDSLSALSH